MMWSQAVEYFGNAEGPVLRWSVVRRAALRAWRVSISAWFAVLLLILLAVTATIGTLLPRVPDAKPEGLLDRLLGLRDIYHSWWFCGLLALLAVSTLGCTLTRFQLTWRRITATATHGGFVLIVTGAAIGGLWGAEGHVRLLVGQTVDTFRDRSGSEVALGFSLTLERSWIETDGPPQPVILFACREHPSPKKIRIRDDRREYSVAGTPYSLRVVRRIAEFSEASGVPVDVRAAEAVKGPALVLEVLREGRAPDRRILFSRNPRLNVNRDASPDVSTKYLLEPVIKNYASRLRIQPADGAAVTSTVRVNDPVALGFTRIFQIDMDHRGARGVTLKVNRDPGLPVVYSGFALLAAGVVLLFTLGRKHTGGSA